MRERRKNLQRFAGNALLLFFPHERQRPHIMQAVGQLDNDHTHVFRHREKHLTIGIELLIFFRLVIHPVKLGDAVHQKRHFITE